MIEEKYLLTQFSHGAGCGCKIAPSVLEEILKDSRTSAFSKNLLVGNESGDDAAVYDLGPDLKTGDYQCLISTTDFFMPIVDDPFDFGRIAATNALSDVYAMGGKPILALAILGWPVEKLPVALAQKILQGGKSVCDAAGIPLAGGHTIDSPEPIFGLSVNGLVKKESIKRNNTAQEGDLLFLTKPIGTGILATALKRKLITEDAMLPAVEVMCTLNTLGEKFGTLEDVHAMTDVTGFGLLGHLLEMCEGSNLAAELNYSTIRWIEGVEPLAKKFVAPDNTFRNWKGYERKVEGITGERLVTLCDPQTSGGLLVAVSEKFQDEFIRILKDNRLEGFTEPIGVLKTKRGEKWISVV
ncbi:MAG TPA: selenide, water dikinase SelD [Cyclobacteriaceae bacterium]|nr:selenide, water dikinase SelD [Cyclobacteriaceae bacterium]